jgi:hypothetical protein
MIIPHDIKNCPYVILVSKGIHLHPSPSPSCVPLTICSHLQELIYQANDNNTDVTPMHIMSGNYSTNICFKKNVILTFQFNVFLLGNLIKMYFGNDYLSEVHASLNNNDRLWYYVDKIQKEVHP